jgi:uncharacterized protein (DUF1697 family)
MIIRELQLRWQEWNKKQFGRRVSVMVSQVDEISILDLNNNFLRQQEHTRKQHLRSVCNQLMV